MFIESTLSQYPKFAIFSKDSSANLVLWFCMQVNIVGSRFVTVHFTTIHF